MNIEVVEILEKELSKNEDYLADAIEMRDKQVPRLLKSVEEYKENVENLQRKVDGLKEALEEQL